MHRPIARTRRLVVLLASTTLLLLATGCGSGSNTDTNTTTTDPSSAAGLPEPGAASASSSTDLAALAECFEANASDSEVSFTQGDDPEIVHGENFDANAPDDIVREAVAAGGWLHADADSGDRVGTLDVFEFATQDAATAAVPAIENGREPVDGWRYGDSYQAVQDGTVVLVLDRPEREDPSVSYSKGLTPLMDMCLPRTSAIRFTSPAGNMSYTIEVPR